jgi:crossover junction endodeoxyribonuclease RuvC
MNILGVDPGIHGGLAILSIDVNGVAPQLVDCIDIPVHGAGAKERVDVLTISAWIKQHAPQHAFVERAQAMPKQGASSGFKYGRAVGAIEAVIACCAIPLTVVEPATWKKFHQLRGGDKESGRQRALQLFPAAHALLARKRDHGRGEAALIALAGGTSMIARSEAAKKKLADETKLRSAWRKWRRERVEELLAGPYGEPTRTLLTFLKSMKRPSELVEFIKAGPWREADADIRNEILALVAAAITRQRAHGLGALRRCIARSTTKCLSGSTRILRVGTSV